VHCAALSISGAVYTWGRGKYGALGHGNTSNRAWPQRVASLGVTGAGVTGVQVVCGGDHTLLLADVVAAPAAAAAAPPPPLAAAAAAGGGGVTTCHRVVLSWGRGTAGATGLGHTRHTLQPELVTALQRRHIVQVGAR
jgi:alpha-tubulin suppressor-like RCC1 family protein